MKNYTNKEIAQIRKNINNGMEYCGICNNRGIGNVYLSDTNFIRWQHYGQSANKNTDEDLSFIINTIFYDCELFVPAEWSDYHINHIPVDKQYEAIDLSSNHPNTFGL